LVLNIRDLICDVITLLDAAIWVKKVQMINRNQKPLKEKNWYEEIST